MNQKLLLDAKHEINSKIGLSCQMIIHTEIAYNYFIENINLIKEHLDEICLGISSHYCNKLEEKIKVDREKIKIVIIESGKYRFEKNYDYMLHLERKLKISADLYYLFETI